MKILLIFNTETFMWYRRLKIIFFISKLIKNIRQYKNLIEIICVIVLINKQTGVHYKLKRSKATNNFVSPVEGWEHYWHYNLIIFINQWGYVFIIPEIQGSLCNLEYRICCCIHYRVTMCTSVDYSFQLRARKIRNIEA